VYCTLHCTFTAYPPPPALSLVRLKVRDSDVLSVGTGTKEDESSTGRVLAARFHHVTAAFTHQELLLGLISVRG
jgi:hypothetical protein